MPHLNHHSPWVIAAIVLAWSASGIADDSTIDFAREIRPILSNQCFKCHGPDEESREAELRLDTQEGAFEDRGGYQAVKPGDPEASEVIQRISSTDPDLQMPPPDSGLVLTADEQRLLRDWVAGGAEFTQHWAFRPIVRPDPPEIESAARPVDRFIRRRQQEAGLKPSPAASRHTLIRRVYLDVTGLPPEPTAVTQFVEDDSPDAVKRLIDEVLQSPHYGEKWGRHWLDQARYADSNGYTIDSPRSMWPWRDWVIRSLNDDMPFDQFTIEQLAGDLLPAPTLEQQIATGFHRNTLINQEGGTDDEQFRNESVVDRVNTTGAVWLGLTVGCAQCHTHKYDPLTQRDYYQLFAFFNSTEDVNTTNPIVRVGTEEQQQRQQELRQATTAAQLLLTEFDQQHPQPETDELKARRGELDKAVNQAKAAEKKHTDSIPSTMVMKERQEPRPTHVLIRGDFLRPGDPVDAGGPSFLHDMAPAENGSRTRLDLARWLVSRDNPLTARVVVNRVWMRLFGRGLVETENDFGLQGTPPTHPQLLDWLAADFMENGWSMKQLLRTILLSETYQQSSDMRDDVTQTDPLNRLWARQARIRVDAEIVRDLALAASGLLNRRIGGPGVYPPQPDGVYAFTQRAAKWPTSTGENRYRRGMYTFFFRSAPHPMLTTFDAPFFNTTCTRRVRSNTPLQSLTMANDEALVEAAQALSRRLLKEAQDDQERIQRAWMLCFSRAPHEREQQRLAAFLQQARAGFARSPEEARSIAGAEADDEQLTELAAWTVAARGLVNLDEFITRE